MRREKRVRKSKEGTVLRCVKLEGRREREVGGAGRLGDLLWGVKRRIDKDERVVLLVWSNTCFFKQMKGYHRRNAGKNDTTLSLLPWETPVDS
jgi:hypothetical protein